MEAIESISKYLGIIIQFATIGSVIFLVYRTFRDPDVKADKKLGINQATCQLKHRIIDDKFESIAKELTLIKENHLAHIEKSVAKIETNVAILMDRENRGTTKI